jgi:hypothetical protein
LFAAQNIGLYLYKSRLEIESGPWIDRLGPDRLKDGNEFSDFSAAPASA